MQEEHIDILSFKGNMSNENKMKSTKWISKKDILGRFSDHDKLSSFSLNKTNSSLIVTSQKRLVFLKLIFQLESWSDNYSENIYTNARQVFQETQSNSNSALQSLYRTKHNHIFIMYLTGIVKVRSVISFEINNSLL